MCIHCEAEHRLICLVHLHAATSQKTVTKHEAHKTHTSCLQVSYRGRTTTCAVDPRVTFLLVRPRPSHYYLDSIGKDIETCLSTAGGPQQNKGVRPAQQATSRCGTIMRTKTELWGCNAVEC